MKPVSSKSILRRTLRVLILTTLGFLAAAPASRLAAAPLDPNAFASLGANPFTLAGTYTIDTAATTPVLTRPGGSTVNGVVSGGLAVFTFNSISIAANMTVNGVRNAGSRPVALLSKAGVTISGTIDVGGAGGMTDSFPAGGAGGNAGLGGGGGGGGGGPDPSPSSGGSGFVPGNPGFDDGGSGGAVAAGGGGTGGFNGGGGAFGGSGGNGLNAGTGGVPYGKLSQTLQGGSGGAGGDRFSLSAAGGGGGGGGAVEIGALGDLTIAGMVLANGGGGGQAASQGGGGGAGGGIFVHAWTVSLSGTLNAIGGGAVGGGGGGGGRVLILTADGTLASGSLAANVSVSGGTSVQGGVGQPGLKQLCPTRITVTTINDSGPGSLRQAIADLCAGGTIDFAPALTGLTIGLTSGELVIDKSLTILGPGADKLAVSGNDSSRVFSITPGVASLLSGLTITGGNGTGAASPGYGGGILSRGATLTLSYCAVLGNHATVNGGGLASFHSRNIDFACTIASNRSEFAGGGLYADDSAHTIVNSTFSANQSPVSGAGEGGGIFFEFGTAVIRHSTFAGNVAPAGDSGGLFSHNATVTLQHSLFANGASGGNLAGNGSFTSLGYNLSDDDSRDSINVLYLNQPGDQNNLPALLGPLQNNGGPMSTHALLPGSPAIGAGDPAFTTNSLPNDQRGAGFARLVGAAVDLGAFEVQTEPPLLTCPVDLYTNVVLHTDTVVVDYPAPTVTGIPDPGVSCVPARGSLFPVGENLVTCTATNLAGTNVCTFNVIVCSVTNVVTTLADSGPGSLRAAIQLANDCAGTNYILFNVTGTIVLTNALPEIGDPLFILGPGPTNLTVTRSTAPQTDCFDIFYMNDNDIVWISGLTIANGCYFYGGGVYNTGFGVVSNCVFTGNHAQIDGGAIYNETDLIVADCSIAGNSAGSRGGGIYNSSSLLVIERSVIDPNLAEDGGGLYVSGGDVALTNVTFSGNIATNSGGAIYLRGFDSFVGASVTIASNTAYAAFNDSIISNLVFFGFTIDSNAVYAGGGGIFDDRNGTAELKNTIVAGNRSTNGPDVANTLVSLGHNLIGNGTGSMGFTNGVMGDRVGTSGSPINPLLGPLQNNGGPTVTHALLTGSPAINTGTNALAPATDQRGPGFPRINGGLIDIGAFETLASLICVQGAVYDPMCGHGEDTHGLWLPGIATDFDFIPDPGQFRENADGTATITGTVRSRANLNKGFTIVFSLSGRTTNPPPESPKLQLCDRAYVGNGGPVDPSTWRYYTGMTGVLTGIGTYTGATINVTRVGPAFQVGNGASGKNYQLGGSAWFTWIVSRPPSSGSLQRTGQGDINIDLFKCEDAQPVPPGGAAPGCLVHYAFEETSGVEALDTSSRGNHGRLLNGPARTNGVVGRALSFDGSNDRVSATNATSLNVTGAFTVACWVRPESVSSSTYFVIKGNDSSDKFAYALRASSAKVQYRWVSPGGKKSTFGTTANVLTAGRWTHVAVVHTPGSAPVIFINGVAVTGSLSSGSATELVGTSSYAFSVGSSADGRGVFKGAIDEVFVCDGALIAAQIQSLTNGLPPGPPPPPPVPGIATASPLPAGRVGAAYSQSLVATGGTPGFVWTLFSGTLPPGLTLNTNTGAIAGTPTSATNLFTIRLSDTLAQTAEREFLLAITNAPPAAGGGCLVQWKFEESGGSVALDSSGSGNHGALLNGPARTNGLVGRALRFDGSDDRVAATNASSLNVTGALTIAAWVKPEGVSGSRYILIKGSSSSSKYAYGLRASDARLQYRWVTPSGSENKFQTSANVLTNGQWTHVAAAHVPGSLPVIYINGVAVAGSLSSGSATALRGTSANPFTVGSSSDGSDPFQGALDDVVVCGRALTAGEVLALKTGTLPALPTPLVSTPPPAAAPIVCTLQVADSLATLTWPATPGRTYRVQYKHNLEDSEWLDLTGDILASADAARFEDYLDGQPQRFYRVRLQ